MSEIKGVVESTNVKSISTKFGKKNKIGLKIEGNWYNVLLGEDVSADKYKGKLVTFSYSDTDYGKSIDAKTLKVAENAGTSTHTGGTKASGNVTVGIKVGHAINNGVLLAIAAKTAGAKPTLLSLAENYATEIIKLSLKLEASFEDIVEAAAAEAELAGSETETASEESTAAPEPEKKPATRKNAAKSAAKEQPKQEPVTTGDGFDDDIPF